MHKRILNELQLAFGIQPQGPLLIKSGREAGADPTRLDMNFVRTQHAQLGETVYLPGSSLKGTLRSYCERIARTLDLWCCNPFDDTFCGKRNEKDKIASASERYQRSCTACRIFGNTTMASHLSISDAYPTVGNKEEANDTEQRDGVAIDRVSGSVAGGGPFNMEVVTRGAFDCTVTMHNYQLWQVGLLAIALRDMRDGLVPLGFGKSRGLGRVALTHDTLTVSYPGRFALTHAGMDFRRNLYGVAAFEFDGKAEYDFAIGDVGSLEGAAMTVTAAGDYGRVSLEATGDAIEPVLRLCVPLWAAYAQDTAWHRTRKGGAP